MLRAGSFRNSAVHAHASPIFADQCVAMARSTARFSVS